jgi:integrase
MSALEEDQLARSTLKFYKYCFGQILAYCESEGLSLFDERAAVSYPSSRKRPDTLSGAYDATTARARKAASLLLEFQTTGTIRWRRLKEEPDPIRPCFEWILSDYEKSLVGVLSANSVRDLMRTARRFFFFLETDGCRDLSEASRTDVSSFLIGYLPSQQGRVGNIVWGVRRLFAFLNANGHSLLRVEHMQLSPACPRRKVLPCFADDEVSRIINCIDRSANGGKRDYAMVLLAVRMGLRCIDITGLKLCDIDWSLEVMRIMQKKTGVVIELPMTSDVACAVADYILNARPRTGPGNIFLRHRRPYARLGEGAGMNTMNRLLLNAGIPHEAGDGKTFHALRRTLGKRLITNSVGAELTAQILGHRIKDSVRRYAPLDTEALRECCMDLSSYATSREGLS